jgi:Protein of unknown function (DUF1524)
MIGEVAEPIAQRGLLNKFVAEHFQDNMDSKAPELGDALRRYSLYSMQQYRTRYLLSKLTQFVDMAYKGLKDAGPLNEYTVLEIEHILPDNPDNALRSEFTAANPNAAYDEYKNKLGNLTLLEKPINIVASNDFFAEKKKEYRKCQHYLTSSIAGITTVGHDTSINRINAKLQSFDVWTSGNIDKRQEMLIGLAKEVWRTVLLAS